MHIDPHDAGLNRLRVAQRQANIIRPDAGRQAIRRGIDPRQRLVFTVIADKAAHRAEGLLAHQSALFAAHFDRRRLQEIALPRQGFAAADDGIALVARGLNEPQHFVILLAVGQRPHQRALIQRRSRREGAELIFQQRQHRIQFTLRQIKALRGGANLPLIQVAGFQNAVDHRLRRQIIQEQRGVFAPQLKGHPFT